MFLWGKQSAYLTVYLTLTMTVMISLCLALIEGVRHNAVCLESECVSDMSLNSILAEYHRELLNQYNLFAIDSSYGTTVAGSNKVVEHMRQYMDKNFSTEDVFLSNFIYRDFLGMTLEKLNMTKASIFTDNGGSIFRQRTVEVMKDDYGLTGIQELLEWMNVAESHGLFERNPAEEKRELDARMEEYNGREIQLSDNEWTTIEIQNPTSEVENMRKAGILKQVTNENELSGKVLHSENLIASRMERGEVNQGNSDSLNFPDSTGLEEQFLFREYLMRYMGSYLSPKEKGALSYQIEYLLVGKDEDVENLKGVVTIICTVREVANICYLYSDATKCAEAEAVATAIATLVTVPEITPLLKNILLLGWAYAESIYDVECLLDGGRVPLMKDKDSWHYSLQNALQMQDEEMVQQAGLSYEDYLHMMLMMEGQQTLTDRAMNMIEADIRMTPGNKAFRLDACYDYVEMDIQIKSKYGYTVRLVRGKGY